MPHVVLLGDSIFDNGAYVGGGPSVIEQLREALPAHWSATLRAVDGSMTADVARQLHRLPADATHLVLSVGGNDALGHADILDRRARSSAEVLGELAEMAESFGKRYRTALASVLRLALPVIVCTIYEGNFPDSRTQRLASTALAVFNDVILRVAFAAGLAVIDLRLICVDAADYANPIEPSVRGGAKIASAIARAVTARAAGGRTEVFLAD